MTPALDALVGGVSGVNVRRRFSIGYILGCQSLVPGSLTEVLNLYCLALRQRTGAFFLE